MRKRLCFLLLLSLVFTSLPGCTSTKTEGEVKQINIGYLRVPNDETLAVQQKYIDDFFASQNIKVNYVIVDSGVEANQAFASGTLDFATMGHTNAVVSLAKGLDTELVWIHELLGSVEGLVVRPSAQIHSLDDLKGKKIATIFSSTSHYSLLHLLRKQGLEKEVQVIDMLTQDIVAAWQRGDIDAAYTWEPGLSKIVEAGGEVLINSEQLLEEGFQTANIGLVRKTFAQAHPDLIAGLLKALAKGADFYRKQPAEAAELAARALDLPVDETQKLMEGVHWLTMEELVSERLMGTVEKPGHFVQVMKDTADFMVEQKSIDHAPSYEDFVHFVNPSYVMEAMK